MQAHWRKAVFSLVVGASLATISWGQEPPETPPGGGSEKVASDVGMNEGGIVTISSKGQDVRSVLFDLFEKGKKNFVFLPNMHWPLYLALSGVEFDEALEIVLNTTQLDYTLQNGIYFIDRKKKSVVKPAVPVSDGGEITIETPDDPSVTEVKGFLTDKDLRSKILTTRMPMAPIRDVFAEYSKQTGVPIVVDKAVPEYKIDSFLIRTSLKFALDTVCRSAGLKYKYNDQMGVDILVDDKS